MLACRRPVGGVSLVLTFLGVWKPAGCPQSRRQTDEVTVQIDGLVGAFVSAIHVRLIYVYTP